MMIPEFWHDSWTAAAVNHLWQSTIVFAVAWLLTLTLRMNQAHLRYRVWVIASLKFLVPFSILIAAGERLESFFAAPVAVKPAVVSLVQQIEQPFPRVEYMAEAGSAAGVHRAEWLPFLLLATWLCGVILVAARWLRGWMQIRAALRNATPLELSFGIPAFSTREPIEPGIFGVFRPVLLFPQGILNCLSRPQLDAIIAHETCHVRRRDNLTYAVHMVVEALFWFHPGVWWIDARLIEERERACDEAVVESGRRAEVYAQGILNVCKFSVKSPLACAAGVTGADLKARIGRIMTGHVAWKLDHRRKALLAGAALLTATAPLALGAMHAMQGVAGAVLETAQTDLPVFDVASIKPHKSEGMMMRAGFRITPDGVSIFGVPLSMLVNQAFELPEDRILSVPAWTRSARYDIEAKVDPSEAPQLEKLTREQRMEMMLPLLENRFGLKFHHETKVMNVYTLVVDKGGPKLQPAKPEEDLGSEIGDARKIGSGEPDEASQPAIAGSNVALGKPSGDGKSGDGGGPMMKPPKGAMIMQMSTQGMTIRGRGVTTAELAGAIERAVGATVIDKTGLNGKYDYTLTFAPEMGAGAMGGLPPGRPPSGEPEPQASGPSVFTAVREQLGLKLVARKEPVDAIVIDHIEKPSPN
jgi:bla regulator protein blaR1